MVVRLSDHKLGRRELSRVREGRKQRGRERQGGREGEREGDRMAKNANKFTSLRHKIHIFVAFGILLALIL